MKRCTESGWMNDDWESQVRTENEWPWARNPDPIPIDRHYSLDPRFSTRGHKNEFLDVSTNNAALKACASVVSLVTYSDEKEIFQGTGTIIEEDGTILTSAKLVTCPTHKSEVAKNLKVIVHLWNEKSYGAELVAYDFYYGIAVVKIQEHVPQLKPAHLRLIDDCIPVDSSKLDNHNDKGFKLRPGYKVIAIGRYFIKPYDLMAAPGEFSIGRLDPKFECKELFRATCLTTETGIGGPLINYRAEVIGVNLYDFQCTPFVPINIVLKWLKHHKDYGKLCQRPLLGVELANLYTASLLIMEKIILKFPKYVAGVIVEDVKPGSSADVAGICPNDCIVECCGKHVRSFLELFDMMWDHTGKSVKLVVLRASDDAPLELEMKAAKQTKKRYRRRTLS